MKEKPLWVYPSRNSRRGDFNRSGGFAHRIPFKKGRIGDVFLFSM